MNRDSTIDVREGRLDVDGHRSAHAGIALEQRDFVRQRSELDQLLGACKNWFTVQRWVDPPIR